MRAAVVAPYLSRYVPGHPLAHADGRVPVHRLVLFAKIGPGEHACHWGCGRVLNWAIRRGAAALVADHVDGDTWNNEPENLVPACNDCNGNRTRWPAKYGKAAEA